MPLNLKKASEIQEFFANRFKFNDTSDKNIRENYMEIQNKLARINIEQSKMQKSLENEIHKNKNLKKAKKEIQTEKIKQIQTNNILAKACKNYESKWKKNCIALDFFRGFYNIFLNFINENTSTNFKLINLGHLTKEIDLYKNNFQTHRNFDTDSFVYKSNQNPYQTNPDTSSKKLNNDPINDELINADIKPILSDMNNSWSMGNHISFQNQNSNFNFHREGYNSMTGRKLLTDTGNQATTKSNMTIKINNNLRLVDSGKDSGGNSHNILPNNGFSNMINIPSWGESMMLGREGLDVNAFGYSTFIDNQMLKNDMNGLSKQKYKAYLLKLAHDVYSNKAIANFTRGRIKPKFFGGSQALLPVRRKSLDCF